MLAPRSPVSPTRTLYTHLVRRARVGHLQHQHTVHPHLLQHLWSGKAQGQGGGRGGSGAGRERCIHFQVREGLLTQSALAPGGA